MSNEENTAIVTKPEENISAKEEKPSEEIMPAKEEEKTAEAKPTENEEGQAGNEEVTPVKEEKKPGKVIIVTGASAGIGYEVARVFCEGGNDIIFACRDEAKTTRCMDKIKKQNPNALTTFMPLDLASLESVRKFVDTFHASEKKLSVLVNNAGTYQNSKDTRRQYTKENFELAMGTNHLGHFLLTNLLLDDLKKSASEGLDARIVVVTSSMHDTEHSKKKALQPLDVENFFLTNEGTFTGAQAYKNSKLANVLFTYELSRQLEGTGVKVNAICPGFVPTTELMRSASGAQKFYCRYVLHGMLRFRKTTRTVQQAAACITALALDEKFKDVTGKYFQECAEGKSSEESMDEVKQKAVWKLSGGYTHLEGYEPLDAPPPPVEPEPKPAAEEKKVEPIMNGDATEDEKKPMEDGEVKTDSAEVKAAETNGMAEDEKEEVKEVAKEEIKEVVEEKTEIIQKEVVVEEKKMEEKEMNHDDKIESVENGIDHPASPVIENNAITVE